MNASFARSRLRLSLIGGVLGAALAGCGGDAIENGPAQPQLGLTNVDIINDYFVDAANGMGGNGGPASCARSGCHDLGGPGGASFELYNKAWTSLTPEEKLANRLFMEGQVDFINPANSSLIVKPLAQSSGGAPHGGGDFFTTADQIYQDLLAWMNSTP